MTIKIIYEGHSIEVSEEVSKVFFHIDELLKNSLLKSDYFSAIYLSACTFFSANIDLLELNLFWNCILLSEHILGAILIGFFGAALFRQINRR